ncbi:MAG TPA: SpoIIE family protein phosphatase [Candidatus Acidoferrales bacterium]|jgi:sigma-B regulation protein RsbU (phosphoserine phosphatase)|nr:SpoIIE family protein phosphatase [Candidatus Acidoferrales bacterium]
MSRFSPRRIAVFFRHMSLVDRVAAVILVLCGLWLGIDRVSGPSLPFTSLLTFFGVAAAAYFLVRLILFIRARGMWALRNRLIVAYFFMAVAPVVLLFSMVFVAAYLLELQIGAHLLRDDLESRSAVIAADTNTIAAALTREPDLKPDQPVPPPNSSVAVDPILLRPEIAKIIAAAQGETPGLRVVLNHGQQVIRETGGRQFSGLAEFRNELWFASAESIPVPGGHATLLSVAPITPGVLDSLPSKLGPIGLTLLEPGASSSAAGITLDGIHYVLGEQIASNKRTLAPPEHMLDLHIDGVATLEAVRADLGPDVQDRPVLARFSFRLSQINRDLLTSVGAFGSTLVLILKVVAVVFFLFEIAALAVGIVLTRTITAAVAGLYDGTLHVRRGDFAHRIEVRQKDQLGALGDSFNEMTGSISGLIEEQRQKQRLEQEVSIAHEVQQQLFPRVFPSLPGLELAAICRPARVVSGDYYDFIQLGPARVGIAVADISGKGIYAALLMASLQAALRSIALADGHGCTADIISRVNTHLFVNTSDDRYATLFYAVYDSETKTLTYTNAGHLAPLLVCPGAPTSPGPNDRVQQLDQGGTVVGLFEHPGYTERTIQVSPGSLLVVFTDGITEPENVYGEEFGLQRVKAEVLRQRDLPVDRLAENMIAAAEQWAGSPQQADDMTVVIARMG